MHPIIVIGASMGGLAPLKTIIAALPTSARASVFVVIHIGANTSHLPEILRNLTALPVRFAADGEAIQLGHVYVAPSDRHLLIDEIVMHVVDGPKVHYTRPAVDPLFESAADAFGSCVMGIVLSGGDGNGAQGLRAIKLAGGISLVQLPEEAVDPSMPYSAIQADSPECLSVVDLARHAASFAV